MGGREDAAHELDRGDREIDARPCPAERELLLDLRGVSVPDRAEGAHHADALRMVRVLRRLAPALAGAHLAFDNDRTGAVDDVRSKERQQREDRGGRVTAGSGHARRAGDTVTV